MRELYARTGVEMPSLRQLIEAAGTSGARRRSHEAGPTPTRARRRRFDIGSILLLPLGIAVVVGAQLLEGGAPQSLLQGAAALIVFGGTLAPCSSATRRSEVLRRDSRGVVETFRVADATTDMLAQRLVAIAGRAHRKGLMALENELSAIDDPFLRRRPRARRRRRGDRDAARHHRDRTARA